MTRRTSILSVGNLVLSLGLLFGYVTYAVLKVIYKAQHVAYIDEIFHVPQAQLYCKGQWTTWNPKITTLPGLYLVSFALLKPLDKLGYDNFCSLFALRLTNLVATVLNFYLAYGISLNLDKKYNMKSNKCVVILTAFNIAIFPPLYFFTFLYYTDVWSITFVLLMYYSHLSKGPFFKILAWFASTMAVLMRQTNIIWVGLMFISETWNIIDKSNKKDSNIQDYKYTCVVLQKFIRSSFSTKGNNLKNLVKLMGIILSGTFQYAFVCLLFICFLVYNGSIVLGDKDAHKATFHPMQNLYFVDFAAFFAFPFFIAEMLASSRKKLPNVYIIVFLMGLCAALTEINKLEHPYLLADNRHLAFYLWKRFFGHLVFRWVAVPSYVCSAILLKRTLEKKCHFSFMVALGICIFLNLTPQYLFELRYFIIPFVMCRLQFRNNAAVVVETVFFILINGIVFYLFLNKPFVWTFEPDVKQRFIW